MPLATSALVQVRNILVATDFSPVSVEPVREAMALARRYGADVCLAHIVSALSFTLVGPDAVDMAVTSAKRDIHGLEHRLLASGDLEGLRHRTVVRHGIVWQELEQIVEEEKVDLMVVGTHARRGLRKVALGSVAEEVFRHATCPVLTVGSKTRQGEPGPILLATDFGPASQSGVRYAVSLANERQERLILVHMLAPYVPLDNPVGFSSADVDELQGQARSAALQRMKELIRTDVEPEVEPEYVVEFGLPASGILAAATAYRAQLIVMGLNRATRFSLPAHFPWATAYEVVCGAACPVLTVRGNAG